jgi:putative lipoic acid-binding regulatory protein
VKRFPENPRPRINYPTWWTYTVIGPNRGELERAIAEVVEDRSHKISLSRRSSQGRYVSLTLELVVLNEAERKSIFEGLRAHDGVSVIL